MLVKCPYCGTLKPITHKLASSGKPIICPNCGKDMHRPDWKPQEKGEPK